MGVIIDCNDIIILKTQSSIFERIYNNILEVIDIKNLKLSDNLENLMSELYLGCGGFGTDLAIYLKTHEDTSFFAQLVKEAIEKTEKDLPEMMESTKINLWNFHKAIIKYAETLKNNIG